MSHLGLDMSAEDRHLARERRGRHAALISVFVIVAVLAAIVAGGVFLTRQLFAPPEDYAGAGSGEVVVEVKPGDSATAIGRTLEAHGVVASMEAFRDTAAGDSRSGSIQPGSYAMRKHMSAEAALALLLDPTSRVEVQVTVREGLRLGQTLDVLADGTDIPREEFETALTHVKALDLPGWADGNVEGLLFPATYTVAPTQSATDVLAMMVQRFTQAAEEVGLGKGARIDGRRYSPSELLTVASIVQAEAPADAMGKVARVIYNRLARHMRLQMDSTVNYATGKTGLTTSRQDRATDSPYNTYRVHGLPPGPIGSPGQQALEAARAPAPGPWIYFVTVNPDTGETKFAVTGEQHQRNVEQFQRWLREHGTGE